MTLIERLEAHEDLDGDCYPRIHIDPEDFRQILSRLRAGEEAKAKVVILEDAVIQAQHLVEFMHGCLTELGYKYAYPEQSVARLTQWRALVEPWEGCAHSHTVAGCAGCEEMRVYLQRLNEAQALLAAYKEEPS